MNKKPATWNKNGVRYTAHSINVDIETGEIIPKKLAKDKTKYIIINTIKNETTYNYLKTSAVVNYTNRCRKQPQQQLFNNYHHNKFNSTK